MDTQAAEKAAGGDEWVYWREAVAARRGVETQPGSPRSGYFRLKDEAIAFWREDGETVCWRSGTKYPAPTQADRIDELFGWCAPHPVSFEDFTAFQNSGRWPDQLAPVEVPDDLPPHERADAELSAQREAMAAWVKEIGGKIATQDQANKAGNFADAFAKIEKASDEARKTEKEPHLEAGRAVDAKWQPVVKRAAELKTWAKKSTEAFLIAERARIAAEERAASDARAKAAREAEEARRKAEAAGAPPPAPEPPPIAPPPQKAKAGKVHLRTETVHEVEDRAAFLRWLAAQNNLPEDFVAALKTLGTRMVKAGLFPDGVVTKTVERAA